MNATRLKHAAPNVVDLMLCGIAGGVLLGVSTAANADADAHVREKNRQTKKNM